MLGRPPGDKRQLDRRGAPAPVTLRRPDFLAQEAGRPRPSSWGACAVPVESAAAPTAGAMLAARRLSTAGEGLLRAQRPACAALRGALSQQQQCGATVGAGRAPLAAWSSWAGGRRPAAAAAAAAQPSRAAVRWPAALTSTTTTRLPSPAAARPLSTSTAFVEWTDAEDAALEKLVEMAGGYSENLDWESVTEQLGTGRAATALEQRFDVLARAAFAKAETELDAKDAEWGAVKDGEWNGPVGPEPTRCATQPAPLGVLLLLMLSSCACCLPVLKMRPAASDNLLSLAQVQ